MKKESRFLKYAIIMSLLVGGLSFGLPSVAEDITSGCDIHNADYGNDNTLNIQNDIILRPVDLGDFHYHNDTIPAISDAVHIVVTGNGHSISGELMNNDENHTGFRVSNSAALTFNDIKFENLNYNYSMDSGTLNDVNWLLEGAIAHSEKTAGSLNFNQTNFTNNTVGISGERLGRDVTMQIHGGLVNNNSNSQISDSSFSDNSVTSTASSESSSVARDHILTSEILGGAVYNTNQMNI